MPDFRTIDVGELKLRVAVEGSGPLVLMVHGFPESWYSWRHQMTPIAEAGFTAAAIDVRGYGGSDKPPAVADYAMQHMVADVAGAIQALSPGAPAVIIGHDWGAPIVWNSALTRPDVVRAVAGLSVPYSGVPARSFREVFEEIFTAKGRFFYQAYFQREGVAEVEMEADVRRSLRLFYYAISGDAPDGTWPSDKTVDQPLLAGLPDPQPFPAWLTPADLDYFVGEFERSGFRGPINAIATTTPTLSGCSRSKARRSSSRPCSSAARRDLVLTMLGRNANPLAFMQSQLPGLRGSDILPGCGHWTQQERPDEVNQRLVAWLKGL
ncbi:MAG: alpha/beta hydrolase [Caulobacteraceae bacterium]